MCTRIWCVRPVSSRQSHQRPACARAQHAVVGHGRFAARDHRHACARHRMAADCGLDSSRAAAGRRPRARDSRAIRVRACSWRTRLVCASSVLATTSRPLVSLSRRCTMPARGTTGERRRVMQQRVEQRAVADCRCRDAPPARPACRSRAMCASSCTIASGISCGVSLRAAGSGLCVHDSMRSPPHTLSFGCAAAPSTVTRACRTQSCRRLREYCGQQPRERLIQAQAGQLVAARAVRAAMSAGVSGDPWTGVSAIIPTRFFRGPPCEVV